ncbi:MAG: hypothetical protein WBV93_00425 [Anaerobacillus sp.]
MSEQKFITSCSECGKDIYEGQTYVSDSRINGDYCSSACCNKAVNDSGFGWENRQAWKD